jgi:hypothetical protein
MADKETKEQDIMDLLSETNCYTYEVKMIVQVIAPNREIADSKLDQDGGYVSKRDVEFIDSTSIYPR